MGEIKRNGCRRAANVEHGNEAFHFVMSGFVEEITKPDHTDSFPCEVRSQPRSAAAEQACDRI
jgi:hypothetical protein